MYGFGPQPPIDFPDSDFVCWIRGTRDSPEWSATAERMAVSDSLFSPGSSGIRRLSERWFARPWERYPHLA
ncbi:MAG: hypothetical protein FWF81_01500 [Defluviitaleaceae bacterium]|nr:hypothetical protein [Defluviitaleaceae bacterium]